MTEDDSEEQCLFCEDEALAVIDREPMPKPIPLCTEHCFRLGVELVRAAAIEDAPVDPPEPDVIEVAIGSGHGSVN